MTRKRSERDRGEDQSEPQAEAPSGNAIYDPGEQTQRRDMPREEQPSEGPSLRGSQPSQEEDRSKQPHRAEERPNREKPAGRSTDERGL
jgi:hypothetical protein